MIGRHKKLHKKDFKIYDHLGSSKMNRIKENNIQSR